MILVDTGAFFALAVPNDPDHPRARDWITANADSLLVTTDYVLDELLTLLKVRQEYQRAERVAAWILDGRLASLEYVTHDDIGAAWDVFRSFKDKEWSFTDCVSYVVMERLQVDTAFAFDDHFRQFGAATVVP